MAWGLGTPDLGHSLSPSSQGGPPELLLILYKESTCLTLTSTPVFSFFYLLVFLEGLMDVDFFIATLVTLTLILTMTLTPVHTHTQVCTYAYIHVHTYHSSASNTGTTYWF